MKTNISTEKFFKKRWLLFINILMLGITNCIGPGYPADIHRENLTLEEAQSLVTFPICMPTYIPDGIESTPQINYETDSPDIPELTYIRLIYKRLYSDNMALEISQRKTIHDSVDREHPDSEGKKRNMVWWILPKREPEETRPIVEQVEIQAVPFETNNLVWWLYEISEPIEYQSTMTWWIINNTEFEVLSFLSVEEIKKITESMFGCFR